MTSPTNEQQRVDVLDALDVRRHLFVKQSTKNANAAFLDWRDWCNYLPEADKARAAVAELIEALSECVIDMEATEEFYGNHPRAQEVIAKAKAALANVGSQP